MEFENTNNVTTSVTKRTLTRKSKLKDGSKWKDYTVQELLDLRKNQRLVKAYFTISTINFMDDILDELKITEEFRMNKPDSSLEKYLDFIDKSYYYNFEKADKGSGKMIPTYKGPSRAYLRRKNHGH